MYSITMPEFEVVLGKKQVEAFPGMLGAKHWAVKAGEWWYEVTANNYKTNDAEEAAYETQHINGCLLHMDKTKSKYVRI